MSVRAIISTLDSSHFVACSHSYKTKCPTEDFGVESLGEKPFQGLNPREKAGPADPRVKVSQTAHISLRELSIPLNKKLDIVNPVAIISYLNVNKSEMAGNKKLSASRMDRAWRQTTRLIHRGSLSTSPELVVQAPSSGLPRRRPTLQLTESETCLTQN